MTERERKSKSGKPLIIFAIGLMALLLAFSSALLHAQAFTNFQRIPEFSDDDFLVMQASSEVPTCLGRLGVSCNPPKYAWVYMTTVRGKAIIDKIQIADSCGYDRNDRDPAKYLQFQKNGGWQGIAGRMTVRGPKSGRRWEATITVESCWDLKTKNAWLYKPALGGEPLPADFFPWKAGDLVEFDAEKKVVNDASIPKVLEDDGTRKINSQ
jgi:hypothetical protein